MSVHAENKQKIEPFQWKKFSKPIDNVKKNP